MVKQPIRITHVVRQFAPAIGGLEEVVGRLASEQASRGHLVRVVTLDRLFTSGERLPARDMIGGAEVIRIPFQGSTKYPLAPGVLRHLGTPDLVHVHGVDFFFDFLAWTRPIHRRRLVATTHGGFFHTKDLAALKRVWFATLTRASGRTYDALVACSRSDEALFAGLRTGNLTLVENGVAIEKFFDGAAKAPCKRLVTIGRFSVNKRLDRLLDGFAALRRRDPEWRLSILGASSDHDARHVLALAAARGVAEGVDVFENASEAEIAGEIGKASLFVSASQYEAFGLTLVEALGAGLLPVVHANEAFRDFQSRHSGLYLADFAEPDGVANAILSAWRDRTSHGQRFVEEAKERARPFEWPAVADRYEQVYADVLGKRRARGKAVSPAFGKSPSRGPDDERQSGRER